MSFVLVECETHHISSPIGPRLISVHSAFPGSLSVEGRFTGLKTKGLISVPEGYVKLWKVMEIEKTIFQDLQSFLKGEDF